ncbi:MAG: TonB-dependent receptor, partial [Rhodomicrobium sp.]|nr:TonB-dependent receptor [Rhodomicrobium sp.]
RRSSSGGGGAIDGSPGARGSWAVDENNVEGYFQVNFAGSAGSLPFEANLGARYIRTATKSFASAIDRSQSIDNVYSDFLPSASVNLHPAEDWVVRLGAARVIARTPLDELRAGGTIGALSDLEIATPDTPVPTIFGGNGNPLLDPFAANQFDVSLEWYFADEALAAVAYYYKDVDTYIGYAPNMTVIPDVGVLVTSTGEIVLRDVTVSNNSPVNGEGGYIHGVELTFKTPFHGLPGELANFGVNATAAFTDTNISEFTPVLNPFDLGGLAKVTANAELWYSAHGVDALVGLSHHSDFSVVTSWESSQINGLEAENFLYFSLAYAVTDNVRFRIQGNNLTNQPWVTNRASNEPNALYRHDVFGRTFNFDVSVTF